jgi:hypothetical protein
MRGISERGWLTWQDDSGKADTGIDPPAIFEYANDPKVTAVRFSFFRQISIRRDLPLLKTQQYADKRRGF